MIWTFLLILVAVVASVPLVRVALLPDGLVKSKLCCVCASDCILGPDMVPEPPRQERCNTQIRLLCTVSLRMLLCGQVKMFPLVE